MTKRFVGTVIAPVEGKSDEVFWIDKSGSNYFLTRVRDGHEELAHPSVKSSDGVPKEVGIKFRVSGAYWASPPRN